MNLIGFAIVDVKDGTIIQSFTGDVPPNPVGWPNGDMTHAANVGEERSGYRLVRVIYEPEQPHEFCDVSNVTPNLAGDTLVLTRVWTDRPLDGVQKELCKRVDTLAENIRMTYLTPGYGQTMIYLEKMAQAKECVAQDNPNASDFPLLEASVGIDGADVKEVAVTVMDTYSKWRIIGSKIESVRKQAKEKILSAANVSEAVKIFGGTDWSSCRDY